VYEGALITDDTPRKLTARVVKGSAWVVSGNASALLLRVGFLALLARLLNPAEFGLMAIGASFAAVATLFSNSGLSQTLVQRQELRSVHISTAAVFSGAMGLVLCLLTILVAPAAEAFFRMPVLAEVLSVLSLSFALQVLAIVPQALLMRAMKFRTLAAIDLLSYALGYGVVSCTLAWLGFGVWALVAGTIAQAAIATASAFERAAYRLSLRFSLIAFKELLGTSLWFSSAGIANLVAQQASNLIVGRMLGAEALGFFSRSYQLMSIPARAMGRATQYVIFPSLSRIQDDRERLRRAFLRGTRITALVGIPASALVPLFTPEIVSILFGHRWMAVVPLLTVLGTGTYFRLGYRVPMTILNATGMPMVRTQVVYATAVVFGCLVTSRFGLTAICVAVITAVSITYTYANFLAARAVNVTPRVFARTLAPGLLMGLFLSSVGWLTIEITRPYGMPLLTAGVGATACTILSIFCLIVPQLRDFALGSDRSKLQTSRFFPSDSTASSRRK
jgi:PST family polysaccharide transporter